jgi:hypothetical protein
MAAEGGGGKGGGGGVSECQEVSIRSESESSTF